MKLNIITTFVVVLLTAKSTQGSPSIFSNIVNTLTGNTVTTTTTTTTAPKVVQTTTTPTIPMEIINNAIDITNQLVTSSNKVLNELVSDTTTSLKDKIGTANQVIATATTVESQVVQNIDDGLQNYVNTAFTNETGVLDSKINAIISAISNASLTVDESNIHLKIGAGLTDITNNALAEVGQELAKQLKYTLLAKPITALSKIAVLNALVDKIAELTNTALDKVPTPSDVVTKIQNILNTNGADLTTPINSAYTAGVEDLSTVAISLTPTINRTVNDIISALNDGINEIDVVTNALEGTNGGVVLATETAFKDIALVLAKSVLGDGILMTIIQSVENTVSGIIAAVKSAFPTLASLLTVFDETAGKPLAANFWSCISTKITSLNDQKAKLLSLIATYNAEVANGAIIGSTVENTILLTAELALDLEISDFQIYDCETIQAASTANVVIPAVKTLVSILG